MKATFVTFPSYTKYSIDDLVNSALSLVMLSNERTLDVLSSSAIFLGLFASCKSLKTRMKPLVANENCLKKTFIYFDRFSLLVFELVFIEIVNDYVKVRFDVFDQSNEFLLCCCCGSNMKSANLTLTAMLSQARANTRLSV